MQTASYNDNIKRSALLVLLFTVSTFWLFIPWPIIPIGAIFAFLRSRNTGNAGLVAIGLGALVGFFGFGPYLMHIDGSIRLGISFGRIQETSPVKPDVTWGGPLEGSEYVGKTFILTSLSGPKGTATFPVSLPLRNGIISTSQLRVAFERDAIQFINSCTHRDTSGREIESARVYVAAQAKDIGSGYVITKHAERRTQMKEGVCKFSTTPGTILIRKQQEIIRLYMDPHVYFVLQQENR
jgi:hypothetical protein